jgi:uncharacterized repeat protein (TIGR03803 family)
VIQGSDGNLYGTTYAGGANGGGSGTVFKITPAGVESVLYAFQGFAFGDGSEPEGKLVQGSDGNFYGTTSGGGAYSVAGTVFKITPAGVETVLYSFGATASDGQTPLYGGLVTGSDGNFYGTTSAGGTNGNGTVFKITPAGVETVLYSFGALPDGQQPEGGLILGSDGNFYGTTSAGGSTSGSTNGCGTVFKITPAGVETVIYSFSSSNGQTDGCEPLSTLIQGSDGNFYGTTQGGGLLPNATFAGGTVFKVTPAGVETVLYTFGTPGNGFNTGGDGINPQAGLLQGSDGNFYGTTTAAGANGGGTVFKLTPAGVETVLYSLPAPPTGQQYETEQYGALIQSANGTFYGTTLGGGASGDGTVYSLTE